MKIKNLLAIIVCTAIILISNSCKKGINSDVQANQNLTEKFFKTKGELKPEVKRIYDYLKSKNAEKEFVSNFVNKEGLLDWSKARVGKKQSIVSVNADAPLVEEPVYVEIPLTTTSEDFAKGFLIAKETSQTLELLLVNGEKYKSLTYGDVTDNILNSEDLALKIMIMNKELYGNSDFKLLDNSLFSNLFVQAIDPNAPSNMPTLDRKIQIQSIQIQPNLYGRGRWVTTTMYIPFWKWTILQCNCTTKPICQDWQNCPANFCKAGWTIAYKETTFTTWEDDGKDYTDYGGGSGGGGGTGTGTSTTTTTIPCNPLLSLVMRIFLPCDPNNVGFISAEEDENNYYNNYQLTQHDIDVLNQIKDEDDNTDQIDNLPCKGSKPGGNQARPGTLEHWLIQLSFAAENPISNEVEYRIPGNGRVDLVSLFDGSMFEIKPLGLASIGAAEINDYVLAANTVCPRIPSATTLPGPWRKGTNFATRYLPNPKGTTPMMKVSLNQDGVVVYEDAQPLTVPPPIVIPQSVLDKFKKLVERLLKEPNRFPEIMAAFAAKPENAEAVQFIKDTSMGFVVGLIVGTVIEDVATFGAGILDDWACFALALKIYRFAKYL